MEQLSFQEQLPDNYCWGCGPANTHGLRIRSYWAGDESVCTFRPREFHAAGPRHVVNGGILASLIDCHSVCTATAAAYRSEGRAPGSGPLIWHVTGRLEVSFLKPTPIGEDLTLRARVKQVNEKKSLVTCGVYAGGEECARGEVIAVRVAPEWLRVAETQKRNR